MSKPSVGIRKLRRSLTEAVGQVAQTGQPVEVTRHGKAVATLVPVGAAAPPVAPQPRPASAPIIALTSLKGGVGKTTLTMHLAAVLAGEGLDVTVLDADDERSAERWQRHAQESGLTLPFQVLAADRNALMRQAKSLSRQGRAVIIDTPPNDREILKSAATVASVVLVPVLPTGLDIDRLATTLELLEDLGEALPSFNYAVLLNRYDGRKGLSKEADVVLERYPRVSAVIRSLSAYERVFGRVPTELGELRAVWAEVQAATEVGA